MSHALPREWFGSSIRNDGVKREKARFAGRAVFSYFAVTAFMVASLLFYVWQGIQVIRAGYEIDRLQGEYQGLISKREKLEVELASLKNLRLVQRRAVQDLGMVFPEGGQVLVVTGAVTEGSSPVAGPAPKVSRQDPDRLMAFLRRVGEAM